MIGRLIVTVILAILFGHFVASQIEPFWLAMVVALLGGYAIGAAVNEIADRL